MNVREWALVLSFALVSGVSAFILTTSIQQQRFSSYSHDLLQQVYNRAFREYYQWLSTVQESGANARVTPLSPYIRQVLNQEPSNGDWLVDLSLQNAEIHISPSPEQNSKAGLVLNIFSDNWEEKLPIHLDILHWVDQLVFDLGYGSLPIRIGYKNNYLELDSNKFSEPQIFKDFIFTGLTLEVEDKELENRFRKSSLITINSVTAGILSGGFLWGLLQRRRNLKDEIDKTHAQLVHSERMAGLGELSVGIVHEINNPVAVLRSNLQGLQDDFASLSAFITKVDHISGSMDPNSPPFQRMMNAYQKGQIDNSLELVPARIHDCLLGVERITKIVRDMRRLSSGSTEMHWCQLNDEIISVLNIADVLLPHQVKVVNRLQPLPDIYCNPSQIAQVIMNLVVNAAQAMDKQGGIIKLEEWIDDKHLYLTVSDNGPGMDAKTAAQVFEPFFTTRKGKGTGLGLALSQRILSEHKGSITLETKPGNGARFTLKIPLGVR